MEPYLGQIWMVGFNFAPVGFALCNGALLSIAQNSALFSLLGTSFGGDGITTFGLPDLRGRLPLHEFQGPGTSDFVLGEQGGAPTASLFSAQLPAHTHVASLGATSTQATQRHPAGARLAAGGAYATGAPSPMAAISVGISGGSQPFAVTQPSLAVNFIIAIEGIYPSRP